MPHESHSQSQSQNKDIAPMPHESYLPRSQSQNREIKLDESQSQKHRLTTSVSLPQSQSDEHYKITRIRSDYT